MAFAWATISDAAWPSTTSRSNGTAVPSGTKRDRAARSSSRSSGVRVMGGSISGTAGAIGTSARTWSSVTVASYQPAMATACSTARCENSEKSTGQSIRLISIILAPRGCDTLGGGTTSTGTFAARTMVCAVDPKIAAALAVPTAMSSACRSRERASSSPLAFPKRSTTSTSPAGAPPAGRAPHPTPALRAPRPETTARYRSDTRTAGPRSRNSRRHGPARVGRATLARTLPNTPAHAPRRLTDRARTAPSRTGGSEGPPPPVELSARARPRGATPFPSPSRARAAIFTPALGAAGCGWVRLGVAGCGRVWPGALG